MPTKRAKPLSVDLTKPAPTVPKIWGREVWLVNSAHYCLKELHIFAGMQCSLHRHRVKDETFVLREGVAFVELRGQRRAMVVGDRIRIPPGEWHRFGSSGGAMLLEISTQHDDRDVERIPGEESGPVREI